MVEDQWQVETDKAGKAWVMSSSGCRCSCSLVLAGSLLFSVCLFLSMFCIFVKIFFFCLFFFFVALFFCVRMLSFGGHLSCQHEMLNQFPPRGPRSRLNERKVPNCAFCNFLWTLFLRSFTLSVVFQVNGINVELCTHKEVVSTEVIHYSFILGLTERLRCSTAIPTVLYFHLCCNWLELSWFAHAVKGAHILSLPSALCTFFTYSTQISIVRGCLWHLFIRECEQQVLRLKCAVSTAKMR